MSLPKWNAFQVLYSKVGSWPCRKGLPVPNTNSLRKFVIYVRKKFYNIGPWSSQKMKTFGLNVADVASRPNVDRTISKESLNDPLSDVIKTRKFYSTNSIGSKSSTTGAKERIRSNFESLKFSKLKFKMYV
jgi:hypothetical protein